MKNKLIKAKIHIDECKALIEQYKTTVIEFKKKEKYLQALLELFDSELFYLDDNNKLSCRQSLDDMREIFKKVSQHTASGITSVAESLTQDIKEQANILSDNFNTRINETIIYFKKQVQDIKHGDHMIIKVVYIDEPIDNVDLQATNLLVASPEYNNFQSLGRQRALLQVFIDGMLQINDEVHRGDYLIHCHEDTIKLHFHEMLQPGMAITIIAVKK